MATTQAQSQRPVPQFAPPQVQPKPSVKTEIQAQPKITVPATPRIQVPSGNSQILTEVLPGGVKLELVKIPAGSFLMGSNDDKSQQPIHRVNLKEFYLGKYLVTQEQWQSIMGNNPSYFSGNSQNPVEQVSWNDCQEFCHQLSQITSKIYRLPSEAEWEYACRAGTHTRYYFGDSENYLRDYAWYRDNSGSKTHQVGQKKPNPWGLYDMYGNVLEWCKDLWHDNYKNAPTDESPWIDKYSLDRVLRGGSWDDNPLANRSAYRLPLYANFQDYHFGFRVACVHPRLS